MKKTKSVKSWLKELPDSIRPNVKKPYIKWLVPSLSEALMWGITWEETREGYEFYASLYESLKWAEEG